MVCFVNIFWNIGMIFVQFGGSNQVTRGFVNGCCCLMSSSEYCCKRILMLRKYVVNEFIHLYCFCFFITHLRFITFFFKSKVMKKKVKSCIMHLMFLLLSICLNADFVDLHMSLCFHSLYYTIFIYITL